MNDKYKNKGTVQKTMMVTRRLTKQRKLVFDTLMNTKKHPTAEEIYSTLKEEHPEISLGTVYRNLNVLCEQGQVQKIAGEFSCDRFDAMVAPHYHFYCEECGGLFDLDIPYESPMDEKIQNQYHHQVKSHSMIFCGTCCDCAVHVEIKELFPKEKRNIS